MTTKICNFNFVLATILSFSIFFSSCSNFSYGKSKNLIEHKYNFITEKSFFENETFLIGPRVNAFGSGPLLPPELVIGVMVLGVAIIVGGTIGVIYLVSD